MDFVDVFGRQISPPPTDVKNNKLTSWNLQSKKKKRFSFIETDLKMIFRSLCNYAKLSVGGSLEMWLLPQNIIFTTKYFYCPYYPKILEKYVFL